MKHLRLFAYLLALLALFILSPAYPPAIIFAAGLLAIASFGKSPTAILGACAELTAFATATENLDQRILRSSRLGRQSFWRNMIRRGSYPKNTGVVQTTFTIKASEPQDNQSLWTQITLSNNQPTPSCDLNYENVGVGMFPRTFGPKQRRFQGPVICKADLTYMHEPEQFLNDYVDEMGRYIMRVWEFTLRADHIYFGNIYVDGVKYAGPNALATAPRAFQGISQTNLNLMATGQINVGAGGEENGGYTVLGPNGVIMPLEIDMNDSESVLTANSTIRDDARFASMGHDSRADFGLWRAIGAERVIGNWRHVPTNISPRFDFTAGAYVQISPFKDIAAVGTDGVILTDAYINADFGGAIGMTPEAFQADIVVPSDWRFPDSSNYNGEWTFEVGAYRICNPPEADPQDEKGRHFSKIVYAPKPLLPYLASMLLYKRCAQSASLIFCS